MSIPHKLSYPPTPVLCQLTGLPSRESETAAELANCWLFLLAAPFRSPASRAKAVRFSRPAERPRSVNMRSESLDTLVPPRFSARPATTAPPMLRMQEQARHHRVDANRQDPAQPRICVPTIQHPGQQLPDAGAPGLAAGGDGEAPRGNREMTVGPAGIIGTVAAGRAGAL